jgi:hypothetical protein
VVERAELDVVVVALREIRDGELAVLAVAEDAHPAVQRDALLLAPVGLEVPVVGLAVDADEAGREPRQRRRGGGGGGRVDEEVDGGRSTRSGSEDYP